MTSDFGTFKCTCLCQDMHVLDERRLVDTVKTNR